MILLIDNYDSFTYNVKQEVNQLGYECRVVRNDAISLAGIRRLNPSRIIISPGPGRPEDSGITLEVLREHAGITPIFGICLGHQAIGLMNGGKIVRAKRPIHGKLSKIKHEGKGVFSGLQKQLSVARYHSLIIERDSIPAELEITAVAEDGEIMGVRNFRLKQEGVQFHPESFATEQGRHMIQYFLEKGSQ